MLAIFSLKQPRDRECKEGVNGRVDAEAEFRRAGNLG